jgi:hypothetical protein
MSSRPTIALVVTGIALVIGLALDLLVGASPPGYGALIGFAGCVVIIVVSKWLGSLFLARPEDFYPDDIPADRVEDLRG